MKTVLKWTVAGLMVTALTGCMSAEEKLQKILDDRILECKQDEEGPFHDMELAEGTAPVLSEVCDMPVEGLQLTDDFHGKAMTGPYTWLFGNDKETGVWFLTVVDWDPMTSARKVIFAKDPDAEQLASAEKDFQAMLKELPDSRYLHVTRAENALKLRTKTRGKAGGDETSLGAEQAIFDASMKWAESKPDPMAKAQLQLLYLDHYDQYNRKTNGALESLGSNDEAFENAIKAAKKEKDEETVKSYTEELEKMRAERPAQRKTLQEKLGTIFDKQCAMIGQMSADGIEDAKTKQDVMAAKTTKDCAPTARPKVEEPAPE